MVLDEFLNIIMESKESFISKPVYVIKHVVNELIHEDIIEGTITSINNLCINVIVKIEPSKYLMPIKQSEYLISLYYNDCGKRWFIDKVLAELYLEIER